MTEQQTEKRKDRMQSVEQAMADRTPGAPVK